MNGDDAYREMFYMTVITLCVYFNGLSVLKAPYSTMILLRSWSWSRMCGEGKPKTCCRRLPSCNRKIRPSSTTCHSRTAQWPRRMFRDRKVIYMSFLKQLAPNSAAASAFWIERLYCTALCISMEGGPPKEGSLWTHGSWIAWSRFNSSSMLCTHYCKHANLFFNKYTRPPMVNTHSSRHTRSLSAI